MYASPSIQQLENRSHLEQHILSGKLTVELNEWFFRKWIKSAVLVGAWGDTRPTHHFCWGLYVDPSSSVVQFSPISAKVQLFADGFAWLCIMPGFEMTEFMHEISCSGVGRGQGAPALAHELRLTAQLSNKHKPGLLLYGQQKPSQSGPFYLGYTNGLIH